MFFIIQTKRNGVWVDTNYSHHAGAAVEIFYKLATDSKRIINSETDEVLYHVEPSERFNMPTAFESRLNVWRNSMETNECFTIYQFEAVAVIDDMLPPYGPQATNPAEHELAVSDVLGMYLMGEEL